MLRRTGAHEPIVPIYTPEVGGRTGVKGQLFNGLKDVLYFSDTHLMELLIGLYVLLIRPYYRFGVEALIYLVVGVCLFTFQAYGLGRQSVRLRERAVTWTLAFMSTHLYFELTLKRGIGFHSFIAVSGLLYLKWRLMRERVYRQVAEMRAERRIERRASDRQENKRPNKGGI